MVITTSVGTFTLAPQAPNDGFIVWVCTHHDGSHAEKMTTDGGDSAYLARDWFREQVALVTRWAIRGLGPWAR